MKFNSIAVVVAVLFCAVTVYAVIPSPKKLESIPDIRRTLECVDGIFAQLAEKYKELAKYHPDFQTKAKEINTILDECEKAENPDTKNDCITSVQTVYLTFMEDLGPKLKVENEKLLAALAFTVIGQCH